MYRLLFSGTEKIPVVSLNTHTRPKKRSTTTGNELTLRAASFCKEKLQSLGRNRKTALPQKKKSRSAPQRHDDAGRGYTMKKLGFVTDQHPEGTHTYILNRTKRKLPYTT